MMHQFVLCRAALMNGLLQSIQDEAGVCRAACPPTDDPARIYIDHEGDIDEPLPRRDIGEVADLSPGSRYDVSMRGHSTFGAGA